MVNCCSNSIVHAVHVVQIACNEAMNVVAPEPWSASLYALALLCTSVPWVWANGFKQGADMHRKVELGRITTIL